MNTSSVEYWVNRIADRCETHFPFVTANVSVHFIMGKWCVRIDSPKVYVSENDISKALDVAKEKVEDLIRSEVLLGKTLGLETAE